MSLINLLHTSLYFN